MYLPLGRRLQGLGRQHAHDGDFQRLIVVPQRGWQSAQRCRQHPQRRLPCVPLVCCNSNHANVRLLHAGVVYNAMTCNAMHMHSDSNLE